MRSISSQSRPWSAWTRTVRRPSGRVPRRSKRARSAPETGSTTVAEAPGFSRAPGFTRASKVPLPRLRNSRASPAPPPARRRKRRAWRTRTSLGTQRLPAGTSSGRSRMARWDQMPVRASTTSNRAPSRSGAGCCAMSSGGRSKWKAERRSRAASRSGELQLVQARVLAVAGEQVVVGALLDDAPLLHGADAGGPLDGAEAVNDHQRGAALRYGPRGRPPGPLALGVEGAGGLVEDED